MLPPPTTYAADAPNESSLLAMPGKGAFGQSAEWREKERKLVWSLKNLKGGREHTLRCRLTGAWGVWGVHASVSACVGYGALVVLWPHYLPKGRGTCECLGKEPPCMPSGLARPDSPPGCPPTAVTLSPLAAVSNLPCCS